MEFTGFKGLPFAAMVPMVQIFQVGCVVFLAASACHAENFPFRLPDDSRRSTETPVKEDKLPSGREHDLEVAIPIRRTAERPKTGNARTANFIVTAPTQELAEELAAHAEETRAKLSKDWFGEELSHPAAPIPITVECHPQLGPGGATSFQFQDKKPHSFEMAVQGCKARIRDSVIPHEVLHTLFATHFGAPLPRWADEGACTTVECEIEQNKQRKFLVQFLNSDRGIPFNKMFAMYKYPPDILPIYAQGHSVVEFLLERKDKKTFLTFVGEGMKTKDWNLAVKAHYGFENLSELQTSWVKWIKETPSK